MRMPNFAKDVKNLFKKREKKEELVSTVAEEPKEQTKHTTTQPNEETADNDSEQKNLSEVELGDNTATKQSNQEDSNIKKEEVKDLSNEDNGNKNSAEDNTADNQSPKADETEPPNRGESDNKKDCPIKQVEGETFDNLSEMSKQASKQVLEEAIDTIIENLIYPKILKNLDDATVELAIEKKINALIEKNIGSDLSERINAMLPEIVNMQLQESVPKTIETYCKGQFAEKFNGEVKKYLDQHRVSIDYLKNYQQLYADISKLIKFVDDTNLEGNKQAELEELLNTILAKLLFQRERWIKQEETKKLEETKANDDAVKKES